MTLFSKLNRLMLRRAVLIAATALTITLAGCQSDVIPRDDSDPVNEPITGVPAPAEGPLEIGSGGDIVGNGQYRIELSATQFNIEEGLTTANVDINIIRENGHSAPVNLALRDNSTGALANVRWLFSDTLIEGSETSSNLQVQLGAARAAIQPQQREIVIRATDGNVSPLEALITLNITPTRAPDVYLLIGQSNMVGSSEFDAREADVGELDAPNDRILQLNVTGNDMTNFPTPSAFTTDANIANLDALTVEAIDPLHDGFNFTINGKSGTQVGLGLSFAKAMLPNTTANILLVPAAWSDSGFCRTDTLLFPGMGWHASPPTDTTDFAGTLLHDRALARLNLALQESGGIFRGILWHQGEADSNTRRPACAAAYEENLMNMVASIRSSAAVDLRGPQARGVAADVPFIAGTMSFGGEFAEPSQERAAVDAIHRGLPRVIPFSATVDNIDLVPPAHSCGNGGCIHFGSTAYREMGNRYAMWMRSVQQR